MAETKKTTITLDNVDYVFEDMTPQQQAMVNHISDLDRKIGTSQFNLDQLNVGKDAFVKMLKAALEPKEE
jgi:hypothetical protein